MGDGENWGEGKNLEEYILFAEPPSAPQNLTVNFVDQSTVILSWNAPHMQGGRSDTTYKVVCDACSTDVKYIPNTVSFLQNRVCIYVCICMRAQIA